MSILTVRGARFLPACLDRAHQQQLADILAGVIASAPLFRPVMPRTAKPFSVRMTNMGALGWVSDRSGYRYQPLHPVTGKPWPPIDPMLLDIWDEVTGLAVRPDACLVNYYEPGARMGLHRDADEADFSAPVVSISLGDTAIFRIGGPDRRGKTASLKLQSGDVVVLENESRLAWHGIDRIIPNSSTLLPRPGRYNLTLRCAS